MPLWDELEQYFASPDTKQRVRELEEQSDLQLENESNERALVGDVISTVALAGHICREKNISDHGIDMEIEFKNDAGQATGETLSLVMKPGDSYMPERGSERNKVFSIRDERHASYWMRQNFPVFLVIRNWDGEIRWVDIRDQLRHDRTVNQVWLMVFNWERLERLDVMSVRRWRDRALGTVRS